MLDGEGAWKHDEQIDLVDEPRLRRCPQARRTAASTIIFYATQDAAYADLQARQPRRDRRRSPTARSRPSRTSSATVRSTSRRRSSSRSPSRSASRTSRAKRASCVAPAISMAINREEITDVIFQGTRTPAHDFTSPVIDGYSEDILEGAEVLDVQRRRGEGAVGRGRRHRAVGRHRSRSPTTPTAATRPGSTLWRTSIKNTLGIEASGAPYPTFAELRTDDHRPHHHRPRSAPDGRPTTRSLFNFLGPLYAHRCRLERRRLLEPRVRRAARRGRSPRPTSTRRTRSSRRRRRSSSRTSRPSRCGTRTSPAATASTVENVRVRLELGSALLRDHQERVVLVLRRPGVRLESPVGRQPSAAAPLPRISGATRSA